MTDDQLAAIESRLDAITPWPWYVSQEAEINSSPLARQFDDHLQALPKDAPESEYDKAPDFHVASCPYTVHGLHDDAEFIAHAPEDIADLLREVRALQERLSADFARAGELVGRVNHWALRQRPRAACILCVGAACERPSRPRTDLQACRRCATAGACSALGKASVICAPRAATIG